MFITREPIVVEDALRELGQANGAVVTFTGVVRGHNRGRSVTGIYYDCYRELAEREVARIVEDTRRSFPVNAVCVRHRIGEVEAGEIALLVVVTAPHRTEAFDACQAIIDRIKKHVPIWKKERYEGGAAEWLGPTGSAGVGKPAARRKSI